MERYSFCLTKSSLLTKKGCLESCGGWGGCWGGEWRWGWGGELVVEGLTGTQFKCFDSLVKEMPSVICTF